MGRAARLPYTFQLRPIDRRPERATTTLAAGDTVASESLDHVGDIDAFTLTGTPGEELTALLIMSCELSAVSSRRSAN